MPTNQGCATASGVPAAPVLTFPLRSTRVSLENSKKKREAFMTSRSTPTPDSSKMTSDMEDFVIGFEDLRERSRDDRMVLLDGPSVTVTCGDTNICEVPLRLLLAASDTARIQWFETHSIPRIGLKDTRFRGALKALFDWLNNTTVKRTCYWLPRQSTFAEDAHLIAAAKELGMDRYVKHIIDSWWAGLNNDPIDWNKITAIERATLNPAEFTFFHVMVKRLADMQFYNQIQDRADYQRRMSKLPKIASSVNVTYQKLVTDHRKRQEERGLLEKNAKYNMERLADQRMWAKEERKAAHARYASIQAKHEQDKQQEEQALRKSANRKLGSGRVNTLTAEEARFAPGRRSNGQ